MVVAAACIHVHVMVIWRSSHVAERPFTESKHSEVQLLALLLPQVETLLSDASQCWSTLTVFPEARRSREQDAAA